MAVRVLHRQRAVMRVIRSDRRVRVGVGDGGQAVERVEGLARRPGQRGFDAGQVALAVIAVGGGVAHRDIGQLAPEPAYRRSRISGLRRRRSRRRNPAFRVFLFLTLAPCLPVLILKSGGPPFPLSPPERRTD